MKPIPIRKFSHLFILFFVSILIVLVVSIFSFLALFESTSQKQLLSYGQIALESDVLYIDTITSSIQDVFNSITFDADISKLLNYASVQTLDLHLGLQRLASYVRSNFFIDSIYIFNQSSNMLYVSSPNATEGVYAPDSFYDQGAVDVMQHYSEFKNMQPIFRTIAVEYPYEATDAYISFMRFNTLKQANQSNVVMINIKQEILSKLVGSVSESNDRLLVFTDHTGWYEVIAGNAANYSKGVLQAVFAHLDDEKKQFVVDIENKSYVVCIQSVMNSDIDIVLIADESDISSITQAKEYNEAMLLLAVLFAVSLLAAIAVVQRLILLSKSHKEALLDLEKEKQELSFETKRRKILSFLQANPSQELSEAEMDDVYQAIGLERPLSKDVHLVLVSINEYCSKVMVRYERVKDRTMLKHAICNTAFKVLSALPVVFALYEDDENCLLVVDAPETEAAMFSALETLKAAINDAFGVTVTVFVSAKTKFPKLPSVYSELSKSLPYRTLFERGSTITSAMLDARQMYETSISETLLRRFSQNVLQLDMASALVDLKQLLESISRGSYKSFQVNVLQLAVALDEVLNKLQVNNGIEKTVTIDSLLYTVSSFESVESLYDAFEHAILQAEQVVVQNKNSHQSSVVTEMQEIIKRMYSVKDFSIITVSEMIGMNASYLGKLFKRNTGTTFIEFLHMVRMEAACNLLATTDLQIVDVVSSVGFSDVPYFYKVFKKANGCTPSTYRQQHGS